MPFRNYSSTTPVTSLTTGISDTDTTITITNYGDVWPSAPFTLLLSHDTANEEVVEVTSKNGTNDFFTITRGVDGTTPKSHAAGAEAVHGVSARDFSEANAFINTAPDYSSLIERAVVDARGDLIAATADNTPTRVAVGDDGTVLTADSTQDAGVRWAPASGGGGFDSVFLLMGA